MTNDEYNDLGAIFGKLVSISATLEMIRFYADQCGNEWDRVFYVACFSMETVLSELNAKLDDVYKAHNEEVRA